MTSGLPRNETRGSRPSRAGVRPAILGLGAVLLWSTGCGDGPITTQLTSPPGADMVLEIVQGDGQVFLSGRRSPEPFAVRVTDRQGEPQADRLVHFELTGEAGGILSQPTAISDAGGRAETFLLEATPGVGGLLAATDAMPTEFGFEVLRGPGSIVFDPGNGAVGLPGLPHPDSLVTLTLLDTEGEPLEGAQIWFSASGELSRWVDTTDAMGHVDTRLRKTNLGVSSGSLWAFMLGFPEMSTKTIRPVEAPAQRVILISVDGLRADALERLAPPNLVRMATEGAHTVQARTVTPSLTVPAHLSLLSGVPPEEHGVFQDVVELTEEMIDLEPLFRFARKRGKTAVAFMAGAGPLEGFEDALACKQAFGLDSLQLVAPSAAAVMDASLPSLVDQDNDLVFLHFPDPDLAGHRYGWNSPQYDAAVLAADRSVGRVLEALAPTRDSVLVMVTSDHGGGGDYGSFLHGSGSEQDLRIPVFLWGARVIPGVDLGEASILDLAPTVLWALGIAPPFHYAGDVLLEGFR